MATQGSGGAFICSTNNAPSGGSIARESNVIYSLNKRNEEEAAAAQ